MNQSPRLILVNFFLNLFKNALLINFIVFVILYLAIFLMIMTGFFLTFYEHETSAIIVKILSYFVDVNSDASIVSTIDPMPYIQKYVFILFIFSILKESILLIIKKVFKKDFHDSVDSIKLKLFIFGTITVLVLEFIASWFLKESWLMAIGICSFIFLVISYVIYRLLLFVLNQVQYILFKPTV